MEIRAPGERPFHERRQLHRRGVGSGGHVARETQRSVVPEAEDPAERQDGAARVALLLQHAGPGPAGRDAGQVRLQDADRARGHEVRYRAQELLVECQDLLRELHTPLRRHAPVEGGGGRRRGQTLGVPCGVFRAGDVDPRGTDPESALTGPLKLLRHLTLVGVQRAALTDLFALEQKLGVEPEDACLAKPAPGHPDELPAGLQRGVAAEREPPGIEQCQRQGVARSDLRPLRARSILGAQDPGAEGAQHADREESCAVISMYVHVSNGSGVRTGWRAFPDARPAVEKRGIVRVLPDGLPGAVRQRCGASRRSTACAGFLLHRDERGALAYHPILLRRPSLQ